MDHTNGTRVPVRFIWKRRVRGKGKFLEQCLKGMGLGGREIGFDFKMSKKERKERIVGGSIFGMEILDYGR